MNDHNDHDRQPADDSTPHDDHHSGGEEVPHPPTVRTNLPLYPLEYLVLFTLRNDFDRAKQIIEGANGALGELGVESITVGERFDLPAPIESMNVDSFSRLEFRPRTTPENIQTAAIHQLLNSDLQALESAFVLFDFNGGSAGHSYLPGHGGGPKPQTATLSDQENKPLTIHVSSPEVKTPSKDPEVHVFILDTLPNNLDELKEEFPDPKEGFNHSDNKVDSLMRRVLHYRSTFHRVPLSHVQPRSTTEERDLVDGHGLFVGGIIRSIVPHAHLHFIRILDDYGAGTLSNFLLGLLKVRELVTDYYPDVSTVINMSFSAPVPGSADMTKLLKQLEAIDGKESFPSERFPSSDTTVGVTTPRPWYLRELLSPDTGKKDTVLHALRRKIEDYGFHSFGKTVGDAQKEVGELILSIEPTMNRLGQIYKIYKFVSPPSFALEFIAAAGNYPYYETAKERIPDEELWAQYPANSPYVVGVGATKKKIAPEYPRKEASYSMLPDTINIGNKGAIYTLGGDTPVPLQDHIDPDEPPDQRIKPQRHEDPSLWYLLGLHPKTPYCQWWAGTSFAAPIVTGAFARYLASGGKTLDDFVAAVRAKAELNNFAYLEAEQPLA